MNKLLFLLILIFFVGVEAKATNETGQEIIWRVEPDTCLVADNIDQCLIGINITLLVNNNDYCVFLDDMKQACFLDKDQFLSLSIQLRKNQTLNLRNTNGDILAQHQLQFSRLSSINFSKRARLPWSFF